jgi:hypothetical protein
MRVIKSNPKPAGWKLWVKTNPDDKKELLDVATFNNPIDTEDYKQVSGNFVFEAEIKYNYCDQYRKANFYFNSKIGEIRTSLPGFDKIFRKILSGEIKVDPKDNSFTALFNFEKRGDSILFYLYEE